MVIWNYVRIPGRNENNLEEGGGALLQSLLVLGSGIKVSNVLGNQYFMGMENVFIFVVFRKFETCNATHLPPTSINA